MVLRVRNGRRERRILCDNKDTQTGGYVGKEREGDEVKERVCWWQAALL